MGFHLVQGLLARGYPDQGYTDQGDPDQGVPDQGDSDRGIRFYIQNIPQVMLNARAHGLKSL